MMVALHAEHLCKVYEGGDGQPLQILTDLELSVERGEFVAIVGASGAGKSTLLHLLGALDFPTSGRVSLDGVEYSEASPEELASLRNQKFSALENVMLPLQIAGIPDTAARDRASGMLDAVGLTARLSHRPAQLSGGEQQRVAVARALIHDPVVVLADEPSGNLDHANGQRLHDLFAGLAGRFKTAVVTVTHNRALAGRADRILALEDGRLHALSGPEAMP
jgi:lipoprotein-releasing system ATP-binding protein